MGEEMDGLMSSGKKNIINGRTVDVRVRGFLFFFFLVQLLYWFKTMQSEGGAAGLIYVFFCAWSGFKRLYVF